ARRSPVGVCYRAPVHARRVIADLPAAQAEQGASRHQPSHSEGVTLSATSPHDREEVSGGSPRTVERNDITLRAKGAGSRDLPAGYTYGRASRKEDEARAS